jgi:hypothetical protein
MRAKLSTSESAEYPSAAKNVDAFQIPDDPVDALQPRRDEPAFTNRKIASEALGRPTAQNYMYVSWISRLRDR